MQLVHPILICFFLLFHSSFAIIEQLASLVPNSPLMVPGTVTNLEQTLSAPDKVLTKEYLINTAVKTTYSLGGQLLDQPIKGDINEPLPDIIDSPNIIKANPSQIEFFTKITGITAAETDPKCGGGNNWCCAYCIQYAPTCIVERTFHLSITDNTGYILRCEDDKMLYVNFRGARSLLNLAQMYSFDLVDYEGVPGAKVHRGYYQSTREAKDIVLKQIQDLLTRYPYYNVMFIGHSFGGPIANLVALEALKQRIVTTKNAYVFTLGSPRIGNYAFVKHVVDTRISIHRAVNKRDIVPHVPNIIDGYVHVGTEIWERPEATYICNFAIETSFCSDMVEGHATSFEDHIVYFGLRYPIKKELV